MQQNFQETCKIRLYYGYPKDRAFGPQALANFLILSETPVGRGGHMAPPPIGNRVNPGMSQMNSKATMMPLYTTNVEVIYPSIIRGLKVFLTCYLISFSALEGLINRFLIQKRVCKESFKFFKIVPKNPNIVLYLPSPTITRLFI